MRRLSMVVAVALPLAASAAEPAADAGQYIGRQATVVSEKTVIVQDRPMLEVVVLVDRTDVAARCVQPPSMFTQGEGSRVLIELQDGRPTAVNID